MKKLLIAMVALVLVGMAAPVWAIPTAFSTTGVGDSNLIADVLFTYNGVNTINIAITNNSLPAAGPDPRLTAFAFNIPDEVTGIDIYAGPTGWGGVYDEDNIDTPGQFGFFDIAGLTGSNFGGGDANDGIARGYASSFFFQLLGTGLGSLSEDDFLASNSFDPGAPDEDVQVFIVRWQRTGLDGEGSDVGIPSVPEPATMLLLGVGLIGLAGIGRKKFVKK